MNINDECFKRDLGHYMPFPFNSYRNNITLSTRSLEHYMTFLFVPAVRYGEPFLDQVHYLTSKKFYKAGQCVCVCVTMLALSTCLPWATLICHSILRAYRVKMQKRVVKM